MASGGHTECLDWNKIYTKLDKKSLFFTILCFGLGALAV